MPAKRTNGAHSAPNTNAIVETFTAPAATSFAMSQRIALEAARFWARRLHAYADQMETLSKCASPEDFAAAQQRFIDRLRDDYTEESKALGALVAQPKRNGSRKSADAN